jgi:hypothetical protein
MNKKVTGGLDWSAYVSHHSLCVRRRRTYGTLKRKSVALRRAVRRRGIRLLLLLLLRV